MEGFAMEQATAERTTNTENETRPSNKREAELREAVERVYRRYGTNLSAFYRDAHRESQKDIEKRSRKR
jgi:hypothetical protein